MKKTFLLLFSIVLSSCSLINKFSYDENSHPVRLLVFFKNKIETPSQKNTIDNFVKEAGKYKIQVYYEYGATSFYDLHMILKNYLNCSDLNYRLGGDQKDHFYPILEESILKYLPDDVAVWDLEDNSYFSLFNVMSPQLRIYSQSNSASGIVTDLLLSHIHRNPPLNINDFFSKTLNELEFPRLDVNSETLGHLYTPDDMNEDYKSISLYKKRLESYIQVSDTQKVFSAYRSKLNIELTKANDNISKVSEIIHKFNYYPLMEKNVWLYDVISSNGTKYRKRIEIVSYWMNQAQLLKESYEGMSKLENYYVLIWDNLKGILYETGKNVGSDDFTRFRYSIPILQFNNSNWQYELDNISYTLNYDHIDSIKVGDNTYKDIARITEINNKDDIKKEYYYANRIGLIKLDEFDGKNSKLLRSSILRDYSLATK